MIDSCTMHYFLLDAFMQASLGKLESLYLQDPGGVLANPVCKALAYIDTLLAALPNLRNLDGERQPILAGE